ncbi:MAG: porin family protein [Ignavibacteriaceae bacterium]
MKKLLSVLVITLLIMGSSFAQVKISGGVLAGINIANGSWDPQPMDNLGNTLSVGSKTGFAFGGVLNFGFVGGLGILAEPMYIQKGDKITGQGIDASESVSLIEIPAMIVYTIQTPGSQVEPYIMAGPSLGFILSSKRDVNGNETDQKSNTSSTDFGATFGAGVKLPVGMNRVFVEARYSIGFSNLSTVTGQSIKSKGFQIFAGITFPFGM